MHRGNENLKSIRIILPLALYNQLKARCIDHGDISKLVRRLLVKYLKATQGKEDVGIGVEIEDDMTEMWAALAKDEEEAKRSKEAK